MASRFGRDSRSDLFKGYTGGGGLSRAVSASPSRQHQHQQQPQGGGYGYGGYHHQQQQQQQQQHVDGGSSSNSYGNGRGSGSHLGVADARGGFRPATPNRKGQYSDAVLNELESQNDREVDGILGKVRILKDMTVAIGDEIRESSALAEKMNEGFDNTRLRLRGTMNRMLVMAEKTGVSWKVWLAFFAAVIFIFLYVWLF
ncbi:hypothetical protein BT67DRAFT_433075 [Trichocladium antarcticum]|uniref:t-SNARE coiled-coil homology domain-containing protein n=1 Tax=Trichocladium antarcticum TaxID=1450529 RepID=A0AAN6UMG9_9PEZI|nr:hypothetical protein BT67DRAFT_433075 [Trichocladium antarcticum]